MLKNYLKIAFRALTRSKAHSAINITGLSLGIACCLLIALFVYDERTFDRFHSKADRIYRVYGREDWGEKQQFFYTSTPFPMGPALKENLPEIESEVRLNKIGVQVKHGRDEYNETIAIVGRDFFKMFDFTILKGETATLLESQNNVVINRWIARKYFGDTDPIGQSMSIQLGDRFEEFTVAGVAERAPVNSSIQFSLIISELNFPRLYDQQTLVSGWFNINPETYVMLREGVSQLSVEAKFPSLFKTILGEERFNESKYSPGLQPLTSIHLDNSFPVGLAPVSDPKYSLILGAIAVLILIVACINFVTLSIGRSLKRAKEVGVRKVVGAARRQLIFQFIGEAVLVTSISMVIGLVIAAAALPEFNHLAGKELELPLNFFLVAVILILLALIGIISGSYPAFVLSSFRPVSILKGVGAIGSSKQGVRKVLVGLQLVLSILLVTCTLVMQNQLSFMRSKDLGFNKEQLVVVPITVQRGPRLSEQVKLGFEKTEQFKTALVGKPGIAEAAAASHDFANGGWMNIGFTDDNDVYRTFDLLVVDDDYLPMMKMTMTTGRTFDDGSLADQRRSVIVNEAFAREYALPDLVGKRIPGKKFGDHEIIGVVRDFNYVSLHSKVPPLVIVEDPSILFPGIENINVDQRPIPKLIVRIKANEVATGMQEIEKAWKAIAGNEEFQYQFVDQSLATQYANDQNLGKIVSIATLLAIVIGSLGLYGLASLAMQNRTKEITIRKVLGATQGSLLVLLSREYVILVTICLAVSVPLTVYLMRGWLVTFEYRVPIGWVVFFVSGGISMGIALLSIGYQTLKTAWVQPAQALKYE